MHVFFLMAVVRRMTVTFHSHDPFTSPMRCAAGMWNCYAGCWHIRYTCPCLWVLLDGWLPWEWCRNVSTRLTGCSLTFFFLFFFNRWVFIYEKGYQSTDTAVSSVYSKMKGVGYTNVNGSERVWDVADYVFPSQVGVRSPRAFQGRWNVDCVCHMSPNWSVLCFPSAASHRPLLTGLW